MANMVTFDEYTNMVADLAKRATSASPTPSCPSCVAATCTTCPDNLVCQVVVPLTQEPCQQCPTITCAPSPPSAGFSQPASGGVSAGAIAGAVVGSVAVIIFVCAATYFTWRFCIKNKRHLEQVPQYDDEHEATSSDPEKSFVARRDQRSSTHTVHSIASTVLTRASNIIQIAYIPGVTNRATPSSPTVLVPPVPPIPIAVSPGTSPAPTEDQHFFVPGDLRDSTYSGISGYSDRTSFARTSYAPRSSVASTIYGKNAVILTPAQTGMRAKAAMVSVRSAGSGNSAGRHTPPVPSIDLGKYTTKPPASPVGSTFSVGSTFLNSASAATATPARVQVVRVGSGGVRQIAVERPGTATSNPPAVPPPVRASVRDSAANTLIEEPSPTKDGSPFSDPSDRKSQKSLSAVIEDATRKASQRDVGSESPKVERERSPFGDEHETHDE